MFYKENGQPHFKCDGCGAVDRLLRRTQEIWEQSVKYNGGDLDCYRPQLRCVTDACFQCAECGEDLDIPDDWEELKKQYEEAEELKHD
jgi:Fe2+ or Zn2+ uptake regulation protein